jgi:hypothetical protein
LPVCEQTPVGNTLRDRITPGCDAAAPKPIGGSDACGQIGQVTTIHS